MEKTAIHVFITGMVQGVGYRISTFRKAQQLGLNGWVRNLPDSKVEAVFEGDKDTIEQMLKWCQKGPVSAVVDSVEVAEIKPQNLQGFEIRY